MSGNLLTRFNTRFNKWFDNTRFGIWWNKDRDHFKSAALYTWLASLGLLAAFLIAHGFDLPDWYYYLYTPTAFVGGSVSGGTYVALAHIEPYNPNEKGERWGLRAMGGLAIAGTITLGILLAIGEFSSFAFPFTSFFSSTLSLGTGVGTVIAAAIFGVRAYNVLGGSGYRLLGSLTNHSRPLFERIFTFGSHAVWSGIGVTLALKAPFVLKTTLIANLIPGMGIVTSIATGPAGLLAGIIIGSVGASAADYTAKAGNYLYACYLQRQEKKGVALTDSQRKLVERVMDERKYEYKYAVGGVVVGAIVGVILAACFLASAPVSLPAAGIAAVIGLCITGCVSVFGSCFSKVGRVRDKKRLYGKAKEAAEAAERARQQKLDSNQPAPGLQPTVVPATTPRVSPALATLLTSTQSTTPSTPALAAASSSASSASLPSPAPSRANSKDDKETAKLLAGASSSGPVKFGKASSSANIFKIPVPQPQLSLVPFCC